MLVRLLFLIVGLIGFVPLILAVKKGSTLDISLYQYAAIGLFAAVGGLFFLVTGFVIGGVLGLAAFKVKENLVCTIIEDMVQKVKPYLTR